MTEAPRERCGRKSRHTPHWWTITAEFVFGIQSTDVWCDGRHYEPSGREGS
jgi:hypothetical protein